MFSRLFWLELGFFSSVSLVFLLFFSFLVLSVVHCMHRDLGQGESTRHPPPPLYADIAMVGFFLVVLGRFVLAPPSPSRQGRDTGMGRCCGCLFLVVEGMDAVRF